MNRQTTKQGVLRGPENWFQFQEGKSLAKFAAILPGGAPPMCVVLYRLNPSKSCELFNPIQQIRYLSWTLVWAIYIQLCQQTQRGDTLFCLETGPWLEWKNAARPGAREPCTVARREPARSTQHGAGAGSGRMAEEIGFHGAVKVKKIFRATSQMALVGHI